MDPVGSTSWHHRHIGAFRRLNDLLIADGVRDPVVMIVGPGAVTRAMSPLLNDSDRAGVSPLRKLVGDAARYGDQLLRRIPVMPLRSLEPLELTRTLSMPHRLIVVDRSRRALAAVSRDLPHATILCVDLATGSIPETVDVAIAFNVICRLEETVAARGMTTVANTIRPGGLLLMDDRSARSHLGAHSEFTSLGDKIYRRAACGAPARRD